MTVPAKLVEKSHPVKQGLIEAYQGRIWAESVSLKDSICYISLTINSTAEIV